MSYLQEFQRLLDTQGYSQFMRLWEEYCQADTVIAPELLEILRMVKATPFAPVFGEYAETLIPLWKKIEDPDLGNQVIRGILDLQSTNSPLFADLATNYLKEKYGSIKHFNDYLRLVGLRTRHKFQGAIAHFELLLHMEKGKFVFHTGGWGVGEIMDISLLREHALIEFEGIQALKDLSFENAFRNLIPIPSEHFLARRFGNPDALEQEGKDDPLKLIHLLLRDLGPKSASEIKDELYDLVIPEKDWTKWWQGARAKIKKDPTIISPEKARDRFESRLDEVSFDKRFLCDIKKATATDALLQVTYQYSRDFPEVFKNPEIKSLLKERLTDALNAPQENSAQKIQLYFLLEDIVGAEFKGQADKELQALTEVESVINQIEIISFKKRVLAYVREKKSDWQKIFLTLLFPISQNILRDYLFRELGQDGPSKAILREKLKELLTRVTIYPDAFFWYFQKLVNDEQVPFNDKESKCQFLEAFFILLHVIEQNPAHRDLAKKMYQLLTQKRYLVFRTFIQDTSPEYLQELLLLASKCHTLSKQDQRILASLVEVVQPKLRKVGEEEKEESNIVWTTAEGYKKIQERIQHIGTVETVDNAKEIESARALGDLRENSEYKFALERRSRLQGELKMLSRQMNNARILTKEDITVTEVGVGAIVDIVDSKGKKSTYTLLGPWDADPERGILSFQSKLAQAMMGNKKGDAFDFQGETFTIQGIKSFL